MKTKLKYDQGQNSVRLLDLWYSDFVLHVRVKPTVTRRIYRDALSAVLRLLHCSYRRKENAASCCSVLRWAGSTYRRVCKLCDGRMLSDRGPTPALLCRLEAFPCTRVQRVHFLSMSSINSYTGSAGVWRV